MTKSAAHLGVFAPEGSTEAWSGTITLTTLL